MNPRISSFLRIAVSVLIIDGVAWLATRLGYHGAFETFAGIVFWEMLVLLVFVFGSTLVLKAWDGRNTSIVRKIK